MRRNNFADTCEALCLAAASFCAEESAAYVRDVYRRLSGVADGRRSGRGAGLTVARLMVEAVDAL